MPFPLKAPQLDFLSNKDTEDLFLSDDSEDPFNFKYVSKSQFRHIIRDVRRQRRKKKEERSLSTLRQESESSERERDYSDYQEASNVNKLTRASFEEVDRELKRLKEDSLPEIKKSTSKGDSANGKNADANETTVAISPDRIARAMPAAGSVDALLTIPEETNAPTAPKGSPSATELLFSSRKTHTQRTLESKSESSGGLNRALNDHECNCNSGLCEHCENSEGLNACLVRPHPMVAHKIFGIQRKISELLDDIAFRLDRIPRPDGDRDLRRRQQRVAEFAVRFSRNYLYDLGRQVADINRHVRAILPKPSVKITRRGLSLHMQAIEQKLTSAHQLLLNALNAYCKHVPSSILKGQPGKLHEILQVVVRLNDICEEVQLTSGDYFGSGDVEAKPLGKDIQKRCNAILLKLRVCSDNESQYVSHTTQSSPIGGLRNKKRVSRADNCRNFPARLGMYSVDRRLSRNPGCRKFAPSCSKERMPLDVVSQMPSKRHPSTPEQPNSSPATWKSSREMGKRKKTKIYLPRREDEISTMMSTLATDSDAGSSATVSGYSQPSVSLHKGSNSLKCSLRKPPLKHSKVLNTPINAELVANDDQFIEKGNRVTDQQLSSLVPVVADLMTLVRNENDVAIRSVPSDSMEALMEMLKKYRPPTSPNVPSVERSSADAYVSRSTANYGNSRDGAKNMQLICLTSEADARSTQDFIASDVRCRKADRAQDAFATLSPARKNEKARTLRVSESSVKALIKYRHAFQYLSRTNPMYTSNSQNKPWDVVAWIADKLVDELIVDVSKELQIEDTIRELFALEFREF